MFNSKNIFIALTYRCNAFCKKCMTRYHINKDTEMSKEIIDRIVSLLKEYSYDRWISVGTGEPLLYSNISYFISQVLGVNKGIKLRLLSNGILLTLDNLSDIFDERIKWGITFDGFSQKSLINFQKGVKIEKVKENVASFAHEYGPDKLYLNYTVTRKNINEILPFCIFAVQNGIKEIYLTELKIFSGYEKDLQDFALYYDEELQAAIQEVKDYLVSENISIEGINIGKTNNRSKCYLRNVASPMIDVDGSVSFCSGREDEIIGNILDSDIVSKWKKYLEYINDNNIAWCSKCYDKKSKDGIFYLPSTIRRLET